MTCGSCRSKIDDECMSCFELNVVKEHEVLSAVAAGELISGFGVKTELFVPHLLWRMSEAGYTGALVINYFY